MPREIEEKKTIYMKSKKSIHASYAFYVAPLIVYVHKFRKNSMSGNIEHRINWMYIARTTQQIENENIGQIFFIRIFLRRRIFSLVWGGHWNGFAVLTVQSGIFVSSLTLF